MRIQPSVSIRIAAFAASTDLIPYGVQYEEKEHIMKHTFTLSSLVVAGLLASAPVFGVDQWVDAEAEGGVSRDMERSGYVGTSLSDTRSRIYVFGAPNSAFPNPDIDETGFVIGTSDPKKGEDELYGSILYDVGTLE
jgi:hypothetical protein